MESVGQDNTTFPPTGEVAVKVCRTLKPVPSVSTANTVPEPELPPANAVPYRVLADKTNSACGETPSLLIQVGEPEFAAKECSSLKYVVSMFTANTVPL